MHRMRGRFWIEAALASLFTVMAVVTLINSEWIEAVFGVEPDGGSGALEWAIVVVLGVAAIGSAILAQREWRRHAIA